MRLNLKLSLVDPKNILKEKKRIINIGLIFNESMMRSKIALNCVQLKHRTVLNKSELDQSLFKILLYIKN